jgi:hypothetical protein
LASVKEGFIAAARPSDKSSKMACAAPIRGGGRPSANAAVGWLIDAEDQSPTGAVLRPPYDIGPPNRARLYGVSGTGRLATSVGPPYGSSTAAVSRSYSPA